MYIKYVVFLIVLFFSFQLASQSKVIEDTMVEVTYAKKQGKTLPVRELLARQASDPDKKKLAKKNHTIPKNFVGRYDNRVLRPELEHHGEDLIRQKYFLKNSTRQIEPHVNIDGISSGNSPHDPTGDIGREYYVQAINATRIGVFDKTGVLINSFNTNTLWNTIGFSSGGDPIILYDQEVDRWLITEFPTQGSNSRHLLIAVSETSDPLGSYELYNFSTVRFPDYPKYGVWNGSYSVTTNEQGADVLHAYFLNKNQLLNGDSLVSIQRISLPGNSNTEAGFFVATPVDWTGKKAPPSDRDPLILSLNDASWNSTQTEDQIEIFSIEINWGDPDSTAISQTSVPVSPYDSYPCSAEGFGFSCIPQNGGFGLDGIPEVIMNQVHYRNFETHESIVMNFITDVNDGENLSGIRWIEMRRTDSLDWSVYQEGTFAPDDGLHRFMGSICMDGTGAIGLAYNVSSDSTYAGIRFTGRTASDPLGVMTIEEYTVVEGQNTINSGSRFGDYAHMSIDPINDRTFWYTSEYANGGNSLTRIVSYQITKDTIDMGPVGLDYPISSGNLNEMETVRMTVQNFGIDTIKEFKLGYIFNNDIPVIEELNLIIPPDSLYSHEFTQTVDLSALGIFEFKLFSELANDKVFFNDTTVVSIERFARFDAGIPNIRNLDELVCGDSTTLKIEIFNRGKDTLTTAIVDVQLNGIPVSSNTWMGSIPEEKSEEFSVGLGNIMEGENELQLIISNPNGQLDQLTDNDTLYRVFSAITNSTIATLELTFDGFPRETSWILTDDEGREILSGGPYDDEDPESTLIQQFCLDPEECYVFTIIDDFGDGLSAYGIEGDYQIIDENDQILANLATPSFGDSISSSFCAQFECMLSGVIEIFPDIGSNDGMILLTAQNGVGPFQYSIDGGMNFQDSPAFNNLESGMYDIVIYDINDCTFIKEIELPACVGSLEITVTHLSGNGLEDGQIEIVANNVDSLLSYSIDGGISLLESNIFSDLPAGQYEVYVVDSNGCVYQETVVVEMFTATEELVLDSQLKIYPNPTENHFMIELRRVDLKDVFLPLTIFDSNGRIVQRAQLALYDEAYKGMISLHNNPAGKYYIRFHHEDLKYLSRVIRI